MQVKVYSFKCPKNGNTPEENEDALAKCKRNSKGKLIHSLAVADGATESPFSCLWARILALAFVRGDFDSGVSDETLNPLRMRWTKQVPSSNLPWYAEEKMAQGSFAALAGLHLMSENRSSMRGRACLLAIGDCCVMRLRQKRLKSFPLTESIQFNSRPRLIGTDPESFSHEDVCQVEWDWEVGDWFILMSDALAAWCLDQWETKGDNRRAIFPRSQKRREWKKWFSVLLNKEREAGALRNDDIALIVVHIGR